MLTNLTRWLPRELVKIQGPMREDFGNFSERQSSLVLRPKICAQHDQEELRVRYSGGYLQLLPHWTLRNNRVFWAALSLLVVHTFLQVSRGSWGAVEPRLKESSLRFILPHSFLLICFLVLMIGSKSCVMVSSNQLWFTRKSFPRARRRLHPMKSLCIMIGSFNFQRFLWFTDYKTQGERNGAKQLFFRLDILHSC